MTKVPRPTKQTVQNIRTNFVKVRDTFKYVTMNLTSLRSTARCLKMNRPLRITNPALRVARKSTTFAKRAIKVFNNSMQSWDSVKSVLFCMNISCCTLHQNTLSISEAANMITHNVAAPVIAKESVSGEISNNEPNESDKLINDAQVPPTLTMNTIYDSITAIYDSMLEALDSEQINPPKTDTNDCCTRYCNPVHQACKFLSWCTEKIGNALYNPDRTDRFAAVIPAVEIAETSFIDLPEPEPPLVTSSRSQTPTEEDTERQALLRKSLQSGPNKSYSWEFLSIDKDCVVVVKDLSV